MERGDFKNVSQNEARLRRDPELKITQVLWIQMTSDDPTSVRVRKSHNILQPWVSYSLNKPKKGRGGQNVMPLLQNISYLQVAYPTTIPIKPAKKRDLLNMSQFLLPQYRVFYESLPVED